MNISLNWLKDFVDSTLTAEETEKVLTGLGLEIARITHVRVPQGIVVAEVKEVTRHPNADKLSVCKVSIGKGDDLQIVCGAPNVAAGLKVPCATIGTQIAPDFIIKQAKLRGVESFGMLCSEKELALSDDNSGLMVLPENATTGIELTELYPTDAILELEITPNRGDCLSILGVARELSAKLGLPLKNAGLMATEGSLPIQKNISVDIQDTKACPRYMGRFITGVKIGPSPEWLKRRLLSAGLRPINNVVDVTNYILLHFGHPMHAFDASTIAGNRIVVKHAQAGEAFTTLDGIERKLVADDLLICDSEKAVALAGIMGGFNSGIADTTTDVFLECAYFDPIGVRKTSKRLGLSSDSSYRFERGVDPENGLAQALDTAAELILQTAGGTILQGKIDIYPESLPKKSITLRTSYASKLLGIAVSDDLAEKSISCLTGFSLVKKEAGVFEVTAPLYRHDITLEADLVEEIGRLYGYDNIPVSQYGSVSLTQTSSTAEKCIDTIRAALSGAGLNEIVCNSMVSVKRNSLLTPDVKPVALLNPLNPDMAQMRTSLVGSMLEALAYNLNRKNKNNRLYEIGRVFTQALSGPLANERTMVCIALEGEFIAPAWNSARQPLSIYHVKGFLESFAHSTGMGKLEYTHPTTTSIWFTSEQATVTGSWGISGTLGKVSDALTTTYDIKSSVYIAHIDITDFIAAQRPLPKFNPLPRFPAVERDFCFVMNETTDAQAIAAEIAAVSPLIEDVKPFDVYRGDKLGAGKKSIAYSLAIRAKDRTLADTEADTISKELLKRVQEKFGVTLRV